MKKRIQSYKNKFKIIVVFVFVFSFIFLYLLNKYAMPIILEYASVQTKRMSIEVLRGVGLQEVNKFLKDKELFIIDKNNKGEIESINFDTVLINETLLLIAKNVRGRLKEVENGENLPDEVYFNRDISKLKKGIIFEVPSGIIFKNAFLADVGPKIPVKIKYSGNVGLDVKTSVTEYGINSAIVKVYIYVEVNQNTILPFKSKTVKASSEIPVVIKLVKGNIPNYISGYNNSYNLPIE